MSVAILYTLLGGFASGVALQSVAGLGVAFSAFVALLGGALFLFYLISGRANKDKAVFLVSVFVLATSLGMLRFDLADLSRGSTILDARAGSEVLLEGLVVDEPDVRESHVKLTVEIVKLNESVQVNERALIITERFPEYRYGDNVVIRGELLKPKNFNSGESDFDYVSYLAKDDIFYELFYPDIEILSRGGGNPVKLALFSFKRALLNSFAKSIPDPESSLLGGLVVGAKQSLGEELQEDFRKTGIIHIVVLSGYNVTIVAEGLMRSLAFVPFLPRLVLGAIVILLFAVMTGASATIVRASIMAVIVLIARATGRPYAMTRALMLAGFVMVLHNPKILIFDASFQLSFLATIGLIYLSPKLEEYFKLVPTRLKLREFATATIATQIFVLPLLLYKMGMWSLVALPVNLLILFVVPVTMLLGFLTGVIGWVSSIIALPFAFATTLLLSYQLTVVDLFASLPFAAVNITTFPLWLMLGIYALYVLLVRKSA